MGFEVILCDSRSGIVLDENGEYDTSSRPCFPVFSSEAEALNLKDELLKRFMFGECWVVNKETGEKQEYSDPGRARLYYEDLQRYLNYKSLPWFKRIKAAQPIPKYFDPAKLKL